MRPRPCTQWIRLLPSPISRGPVPLTILPIPPHLSPFPTPVSPSSSHCPLASSSTISYLSSNSSLIPSPLFADPRLTLPSNASPPLSSQRPLTPPFPLTASLSQASPPLKT